MSIQFRTRNGEPTAIGGELLAWWKGLDDDRAGRAILRRASSPTLVAFTAPYQRLYRRLQAAGWPTDARPQDNDRLAAIVGLLAHVKENVSGPVPVAMSECNKGDDRPQVSELRFLRLLDAPDIDALYTGLRRVLPLMKHQLDVLALANDFLHWDDDVKKRWAYGYHWPDKTSS
ncbi:MAG: type I-E CRISPR-associated protein Cse2/CasB [Betaproteobacteria bacterium]|mgnify:CR=1 FL=1|nr:type I-E CRISPR-associated protein Cse2/CasB [Betaproteobacteria bacterium]HMV21660.1 type I-E CRISPR-associated protein Cse2/CasB [Rhodocyclaceae bacterium]HNE15100.1 type I-E CRISPR-associated protein Cse2/CasB [Rhodocyclaceae bacterium]HNM81470.1 type I-E CRISPR-associated protein Cse2/CasB [Rhodocyclaceae bacterium]